MWPRRTIQVVNPLRRLLFGSGRLSDDLRTTLTAEGIVFLDEGLPGSVTYRNFRAPGRYSNWRKSALIVALAVTSRRLLVVAGRGGKMIDVPLDDPRRAAVTVGIEPPDRVVFTVDVGAFSPDRSGTMEIRLRTARAAEVVALLDERR